jgi:uncharacterized protein
MMVDIDEMSSQEIRELLHKVGYGHLGVIHAGKPYVMPMRYYMEAEEIYCFTTEGMKTHDMDLNPEVCLQVEEIIDPALHWRSVIVMGQAQKVTDQQEIDHILKFIKEANPTLSPAVNRTWVDSWGRAEVMAIYRIIPSEMTGRTTDGISSKVAE